MISVLSHSWKLCTLIATGPRVTNLNGFVSEQGRVCMWCVCTGPVLCKSDPRPSFIVLAHWNTMPRAGSDVPTQTIILTPCQSVGLLTPLCWAVSRAAEPQILISFVWHSRGSNHQPPACQVNAQPLHYPAAVYWKRKQIKHLRLLFTSNIVGYWWKPCPILLGASKHTKHSKFPDCKSSGKTTRFQHCPWWV